MQLTGNVKKQVLQSLQLLQYHEVLLHKVVGGASMHDSVWNQFLHAEPNYIVSGKSVILQTQYTGTSSTDWIMLFTIA